MKRKLTILGIGPGNPDFIIPIVWRKLKKIECIVAHSRLLTSISKKINLKNFKKIILLGNKKNLEQSLFEITNSFTEFQEIGVLVSGDPCLYSLTSFLRKKLGKCEFEIIPGISSIQYFYSKINRSTENIKVVSGHGRNLEINDYLDSEKDLVILTDKNNNVNSIINYLINSNYNKKVIIGENLSYSNEKILFGKPEDFINYPYIPLTLLTIIENET